MSEQDFKEARKLVIKFVGELVERLNINEDFELLLNRDIVLIKIVERGIKSRKVIQGSVQFRLLQFIFVKTEGQEVTNLEYINEKVNTELDWLRINMRKIENEY